MYAYICNVTAMGMCVGKYRARRCLLYFPRYQLFGVCFFSNSVSENLDWIHVQDKYTDSGPKARILSTLLTGSDTFLVL